MELPLQDPDPDPGPGRRLRRQRRRRRRRGSVEMAGASESTVELGLTDGWARRLCRCTRTPRFKNPAATAWKSPQDRPQIRRPSPSLDRKFRVSDQGIKLGDSGNRSRPRVHVPKPKVPWQNSWCHLADASRGRRQPLQLRGHLCLDREG